MPSNKNSPTNLILRWSKHRTVDKANFSSVLHQASFPTYLKPELFIRLLLEISLFLKPREENSDWGKRCKAPRLCFCLWFTIQIQTSSPGRNSLAGAFDSVSEGGFSAEAGNKKGVVELLRTEKQVSQPVVCSTLLFPQGESFSCISAPAMTVMLCFRFLTAL